MRTRENTEFAGKDRAAPVAQPGPASQRRPTLGEGLGGGAAGRRRGALVSKGWGEAYGGRGGSEPGSSPGPGTLLRRSPRFGDPAAAAPGARAPGLRGQLPGRAVRAER